QPVCFFFQAEDGIRDRNVTGVQTCALPIFETRPAASRAPRAPILRGASAAATSRTATTRTVGNPTTDNPGRPLRAGPPLRVRPPHGLATHLRVRNPYGAPMRCMHRSSGDRLGDRCRRLTGPAGNSVTLSCGVCPAIIHIYMNIC